MTSNEIVRSERISRPALLLLAISAIWCVLWFFHSMHYWEDDAYIHLEFARSVANGQGFSFNGHVVYGDTSPLWVYLLVAFHTLIPDWMTAGKALSVCGILFGASGAFFYARKLTGDALFGAAMVLLFVTNPYFNYWSFSGMETIAAAGIAFYGATLVSDRLISWPRFFAACLLVGVAPITRPEMVFFGGILGLVLFYRWIYMPGKLVAKVPGLIAGFVLAAGPSVAWGMYAVHAFGRLVPNTNAAKRAALHDSVVLRLVSIYTLGFPLLILGVLALLVYVVLRLRTKGELGEAGEARPLAVLGRLPLGGWIFIVWSCITTFFYIVNHTFVQTRYILVSAPGVLFALLALLMLIAAGYVRPVWAVALAAAVMVSILATWPFIRNKSEHDQIMADAALWTRDHIAPDAPVAIYSIGEFAFVSQHPIVDTGAITRPSVLPYLEKHPGDLVGWIHTQGGLYYVIGEKPEPNAVLVYSHDAPTIGWNLNPARYKARETFKLWKLPPAP